MIANNSKQGKKTAIIDIDPNLPLHKLNDFTQKQLDERKGFITFSIEHVRKPTWIDM